MADPISQTVKRPTPENFSDLLVRALRKLHKDGLHIRRLRMNNYSMAVIVAKMTAYEAEEVNQGRPSFGGIPIDIQPMLPDYRVVIHTSEGVEYYE